VIANEYSEMSPIYNDNQFFLTQLAQEVLRDSVNGNPPSNLRMISNAYSQKSPIYNDIHFVLTQVAQELLRDSANGMGASTRVAAALLQVKQTYILSKKT